LNEILSLAQDEKSAQQMAEECLSSFDEVVNLFQPKLQKFIYSIVGETELAYDLTQDTFLAAFSHLQNQVQQFTSSLALVEPSHKFNLSSWLYTIAHNKAIDAVRRRRNTFYTSSEALMDYKLCSPTAQADKNVEARIIAREELEQAIKKVGRPKLNYFLMYHNGFSYQEIAEIFGTSLSIVKGKIFRAKKSLREALSEKSPLLSVA